MRGHLQIGSIPIGMPFFFQIFDRLNHSRVPAVIAMKKLSRATFIPLSIILVNTFYSPTPANGSDDFGFS
jgi:hypothetical protein